MILCHKTGPLLTFRLLLRLLQLVHALAQHMKTVFVILVLLQTDFDALFSLQVTLKLQQTARSIEIGFEIFGIELQDCLSGLLCFLIILELHAANRDVVQEFDHQVEAILLLILTEFDVLQQDKRISVSLVR